MDETEKEILHHKFKVEDEQLTHNFKVQDIETDNSWKSCCLILDKRFVQFFTQMSVIILIIVFCIVQLVRLDDCNNQRAYVGLLTFIIGILLPQPTIK